MTKLRRILLQGIASDEKLDLISRYARMLIEQGKRDPRIRDLAVAVTRGCRSKEYLCEARTLHDYVRENVRYVKDIASVERFATPQRTLFMEKAGDCDDSSIALSALLESIGHETRLILIDADLSGKFTHVISQVRLGDTWYWMETTRKVPFNWAPRFSVSHIIDKKTVSSDDIGTLDTLFDIGEIGDLGRSKSRKKSKKKKKAPKRARNRISKSRGTKARAKKKVAQRAKSKRKGIVKNYLAKRKQIQKAVAKQGFRIAQKYAKKSSKLASNFKQRAQDIRKKAVEARTQKQKAAETRKMAQLKRKAEQQRLKLEKQKLMETQQLKAQKETTTAAAIQTARQEQMRVDRAEDEAERMLDEPEEQAVYDEAPPEEYSPDYEEDAYFEEEEPEFEEDFEPEDDPEFEDEYDDFEYEDDYEPEDEFDDEFLGALRKKRKKKSSRKVRRKRAVLAAARRKPKGTTADRLSTTAKLLGLMGIGAWAAVNLFGKMKDRRG